MTNAGARGRESGSDVLALDVWLAFLERSSGNDDASFQDLCRRHAGITRHLEELRARWRRQQSELPPTELPLQERLRSLSDPLPRGQRFRREGEIARGG